MSTLDPDTVVYKNQGHAFFVEDGSEVRNTFEGNLGILTMRTMALLESDMTPATFWFVNPDNYVVNNVAAGGQLLRRARGGTWLDFGPGSGLRDFV